MAITEQQLSTWSHQGSTVQSASTYATIRGALNDPNAPYAAWAFDVFLQGSYGNNTNIYADSDVDVAICLTSVFYDDTTELTEEELSLYKAHWTAGGHSFDGFKAEVLSWLKSKFGDGVVAGKKAIFIPGNGSRRDADVLVCVNHKAYSRYVSSLDNTKREGICFWTSDKEKIINYPKQHLENCSDKNKSASERF